MDARLVAVESRLHALEEMVGKVALDSAEIKGAIRHMPTTMQVWMAVLGCTALVFGAVKFASH